MCPRIKIYVLTMTQIYSHVQKQSDKTWVYVYDHVQSFADGQNHIFGYFQSYRLENKSMGVVFRVEFDGDVRFFVAPPKSMFLSFFIDFFDVFCNFFVFQVFVKI